MKLSEIKRAWKVNEKKFKSAQREQYAAAL